MRSIYYIYKIAACIGMMVIMLSCKKEIVYEGIKGDLKGKIYLLDYKSKITDFSGVSVTIDGSSPVLKTITNEKGEYELKDVKTGIYDIVFSKDGFGTYKLVSYQFIGGTLPTLVSPLQFYKQPDFTINDFKIDTFRYSSYFSYVTASASLPVSANGLLRYYVSYNPDVSYTNYQATDITYTNGGAITFNLNNTLLSKFPKGKQLYIIMYPYASSAMSYLDITTGNQIYSVNTSKATAVVPFMIPITQSF